MSNAIKPVEFKQANMRLESNREGVKLLPVFNDGKVIISCWRIPFWTRFKILFTGIIWVSVVGKCTPPIAILSEAFVKAGEE